MRILVVSLLLNVAMQTKYTSTYVEAEMIHQSRSGVNNAVNNPDFSTIKAPVMNFGTDNSTRILAQSGSTALLPCIVHSIGEGTVTWIRRKSIQHQLLTVGLTTYASDGRFQAIHFHHSEDWTLQIKYVQPRDAGMYECQVSTHPPTSIFLFLEVVEARAEIVGPPEKFVRPGSTLQLHCLVKNSTETPSYLFWYHNSRMINYDSDQGVNVSTDLVVRESWLDVPKASDRHSGNYTCEASNAVPARVFVDILNGDNPAAMQHSLASLDKNSTLLITFIWLTIFVIPSTFF
uniref:Lsamp_0 protein n=1 Tax=Fopius arisanus TaxID=64838 RepID=A0A0C9RYT4_9HYME